MGEIRHDHIAADYKIVAAAHGFKRRLEAFTRSRCAWVLKAVIAAKGDEAKAAGLSIVDSPGPHI
jgi:hypothetical protein